MRVTYRKRPNGWMVKVEVKGEAPKVRGPFESKEYAEKWVYFNARDDDTGKLVCARDF